MAAEGVWLPPVQLVSFGITTSAPARRSAVHRLWIGSGRAALAWLRERQVVVPALSTIESLVRSARSEAERDIYLVISNALTEEEKRQLDELWRISPQNGSMLGWLRRSPRSGTAAGILDLLNRLDWIRQVGLPEDALGSISPSRIRQLAARGGRHSGQHFRRFPEEKRYAILVSFLLYTAAELTDRSVEFHIRLMGRLLNRAEKRQKMQVLGHGQSLNKHLHQFVRLAKALVAAHHQATDLSKAVESIVSWDALAHQVQLAEGAIPPTTSQSCSISGPTTRRFASMRRSFWQCWNSNPLKGCALCFALWTFCASSTVRKQHMFLSMRQFLSLNRAGVGMSSRRKDSTGVTTNYAYFPRSGGAFVPATSGLQQPSFSTAGELSCARQPGAPPRLRTRSKSSERQL